MLLQGSVNPNPRTLFFSNLIVWVLGHSIAPASKEIASPLKEEHFYKENTSK